MASIDHRHERKSPVVRIEAPTITLPNGASAEVTETVRINMTIKTIVVRTGDATAAITYTLKIRDDNGAEHLSKDGLEDDKKNILLSTKAAPDFDEISLNGVVTIGITPSDDPTGTGVDVNVDLIGV